MVKTSRLIWYAGLVGVLASGTLNVLFLVESMRMVTIQVPSHTLEPYQTIGANDVTTKQVSATSLDADAVTGNLVGRVTAMTIAQGDQVQHFEIAQQGSMAQVIQNLYVTHPNDAFAQIQVQNNGLSQTVQPGQHVNFIANNMTYPDVWVLSVTNPTNGMSSAVSQAVTNFVSVNPPASSSGGTLTMLIGAPWSTVQALMSAGNTQVVMGNVGVPYSLGTPPVNQAVQGAPSGMINRPPVSSNVNGQTAKGSQQIKIKTTKSGTRKGRTKHATK